MKPPRQTIPSLASSWVLGGFFIFCFSGFADPITDRVKIRKHSTLKAPSLRGLDAEEYNAEKAALLAVKRRALIEDIKRFIRDARDSEQVAELNLRLGNLYMEDYYAGMAKAQQEFDTRTTAWEKNKRKGKPPEMDSSEARVSLVKARALYRETLRRAPHHPRRDEVYYFLAVSSMDEGHVDEGIRFLSRLVNEIPRSKYAAEALVQLGDHHFEKNQFRDARIYYDRLISLKFRPLLPYATYKKAWCAFNMGAHTEAIKQFKWVIAYGDKESDGSALRIRNEALRDIALPFSEIKSTEEALAFFKSQGMPFYRTGMETLASIYFDKGFYEGSNLFYEQLLSLDSGNAKNPEYELRIVEAFKNLEKDETALQRLFSRLPVYVTPSGWYELHSNNPATIQGAFRAFEEATRNYAIRYHALGQKTKNEASYQRAKNIYTKYLEFFPKTEHAPQMRFYLAEIQYKQQHYVAAAENYYKVYHDPQAGKLRTDAIRYTLSALDQQLNADRKKAGLGAINNKATSKLAAKEEDSLELLPYSAVENQFFAVSEEYLKHFAQEKEAGDVLYEQSYLRYSHHDLSEAYRDFWALVQKYPSHATAISSAYLILDILNRKKEYAKLITACQKFLDTKEFAHAASFRREIADILRKSELKRIALLEEKSEFKEAAERYIEYTKSYGTQDETLFEKSLYNAAVNFNKAGLLLPAVETQEHFLRRFPKSQFRENMLLQVAKTYETLALFDKSGKYFEEFAVQYPKHPQSKNALRLAGLYLSSSGSIERAENVFLRFIKLYPADLKLVERDLLGLYEASNAVDKQIQYYLRARAMRGITVSEYLFYTLAAAELSALKTGKLPVGTLEEARRLAEKHSAEIRKTPKGVEALAKVRFWWVSQREALFQRYKLALPQEAMATNLKRKLLLLQELEKEYGKIASLGNAEWGLGAIYKTGAIYRHMAEAVLTAPVPPELTAEQIENYRAELKQQMIVPFNEKAKGFAANCLDKAQEFAVLSTWTAQCYQLASELEPERYPKIRTFYLPSLTLAIQPPAKEAKTELGGWKRFAYPFYSSSLFAPNRQLASLASKDLPPLYDTSAPHEAQSNIPSTVSYEILGNERRRALKSQYDSERPADPRRGLSFSFLNAMRLTAASKSIPLIESAIQKDPQNSSLINLLGLAYLEAGKRQAANVCWLSLVARGQASASVWNNLGVAATREGNEPQAIAYFQEAVKQPGSKDAWVNLGFLALKYRNGFEAKNYFKKALSLDEEDVPAQIGFAVSLLQNREMDNAKDKLVELSRRYEKDPYLKLSLGYYLIDIEHESEVAQKIISDYVDSQSADKDLMFRQLLLEARHRPNQETEANENEAPVIE
jgi:TolA-binding protein/Flp pilus assembly protein TadD